jgi:hypothetical protein
MREEYLDARARMAVVRMARREAAALSLVPGHADRVESPVPAVELILRDCPACGATYPPSGAPVGVAVALAEPTGRGRPSVDLLACEELTVRSLLFVAVQAATGAANRFMTRSLAWHSWDLGDTVGARLFNLDRREASRDRGPVSVLPVATRRVSAPPPVYVNPSEIVAAHERSPVLDSANDLYHAARARAVTRLFLDGPTVGRTYSPSFGGGNHGSR